MKSVKYNLVLALCLFGLGLSASSQRGTLKLHANYSMAVPLGNFKDITSNTSFNGWDAAIMYGITDQFSAGVQTGFQDFYQKNARTVYHSPGSDISAVITNSVQLSPLLLKGAYKFTGSGMVQPFVALGLGGNFVQYRKYYGQFSDARSKISFMAQPEAGLNMPVGKNKRTGIYIAAAYSYIPFKYNDAHNFNSASLKAGVSIPLR